MGGRAWAVVAAIGAAGCGGGDEDSRGEGSAVTASTSAAMTSETGKTSGTSTGGGETGPASASSDDGPLPTTEAEPSTGSTGSSATSSSASSDDSSGGSSGDDTGAPACGDGAIVGDEVCDDGNVIDGDGCNADCQPSGRVLWSDRFGGGLKLVDEALDCDVDGFGSIYVTGFTSTTKPNEDIWTRSYDVSGTPLWTQIYGGSTKDRGEAVVVDASQLVFVGGHENVTDESNNVWVRKHAADGATTWTVDYNSPTNGADAVYAAALTSEGDLIAVGAYAAGVEGADVWMRRLDPGGATLWTRTYSGAAGLGDYGRAVAVGDDGYIYVAGEEDVMDEGANMWTARFDADGNLLWSRLYSGAAGLDDVLFGAVAVDGGVVVCGQEKGDVVRSFVREYDEAGLTVWTVLDAGDTEEGAGCNDVDVTAEGDVLVAGLVVVATRTVPLVRRLTGDGALRWSTTIPVPGTGASQARSVRSAPDGTIVIAGGLDMGVDGRDAWVGRLSP